MKNTNIMKRIGKRKNKGFTLIEIIVAVTIIIILSTLAVPRVSAYIDKAKEAKVTSIGKQIYTAAMWSFTDSGNKFESEKVATAVSNTTNIALTADSVSTSDSKILTVNFSTGNKDYILSLDSNTDIYKIDEKVSSTETKPIFDSSK